MASIQFTESDRDERGFIRAPEPRSLADLLPPVESIKPATIQRQPLSRHEVVVLCCVGIAALYVFFYAWATPGERAPVSLPTAVPTLQATIAQPTVAPVLTAYFDYANSDTAVGIDPSQIERVIGQSGGWRLVIVGSARVWVEETQVGVATPIDNPLPDLAPRTPVPQVAPQAPASLPQPTQCAVVGVAGKMISACGYAGIDELQAEAQAAWLETYGGNVGVVDHPTPQVMR